MKDLLKQLIDNDKCNIYQLGQALFETPELGFKEFKTKEILIDHLAKHNITVDKEYYQTGFQVSIGSGYPHIGLIAELDAIPTLDHPVSDPITKAAHSCGHSTQLTIMTSALIALKKANITTNFQGKITLFFTPAEEFTDINYRKQLINENKIKYLSGKENMLADHIFDDVDLLIHLHASGSSEHRFSINSTLAGFIYKTFTFKGKASHAAVLPHEGINALNAFSLFSSALAMKREAFKEEDMVRIHGIVTHGGDTVNSIPERIVYEAYVRSINPHTLLTLSEEITSCAKHCASALKAECLVEDTVGYLPLIQDKNLNEIVYENLLQFTTQDKIKTNERSVAAGDVGDISVLKPIIQYGYTGFSGIIHGKDLKIANPEEIYLTQAKIITMIVFDLLSKPEKVKKIKDEFVPKMTHDEYLAYLNK